MAVPGACLGFARKTKSVYLAPCSREIISTWPRAA